MMERNGRRTPLVALGALIVVLFAVACRESKREGPPAADASTPPVAAVPAESASVGLAVRAVEDEHVEIVDAGPDGAVVKRRRIVRGADAAVVIETAPAPPPSPEPAADPRRAARSGSGMTDELPYGGAAGSADRILKKTPLPSDDPWAKTDAPK